MSYNRGRHSNSNNYRSRGYKNFNRGNRYSKYNPSRSRGDRGRGRGGRGRGRGGYNSNQYYDDYYADYYGGGYYGGYYEDYYYEESYQSHQKYPKPVNQFTYTKDLKAKDFKTEETKQKSKLKTFLHDEKQVINNLEKLSRKGIISVLMVTEKPSIAKTIAQILSNNTAKETKGIFKPCPVWRYEGDFKGFKASFKVTSVTGHMYSRDFPK